MFLVQSALARRGAWASLWRMDIDETRARLIRLQSERWEALELGIASPSPYLTRLDAAIADAREQYVMSAVSEIALLRRSLAAPAQD